MLRKEILVLTNTNSLFLQTSPIKTLPKTLIGHDSYLDYQLSLELSQSLQLLSHL